MNRIKLQWIKHFISTCSLLALSACTTNLNNPDTFNGLTVKVLVGSALDDFCNQTSQSFNQQQPRLDNGTPFRFTCEAKGSGDVVATVVGLA